MKANKTSNKHLKLALSSVLKLCYSKHSYLQAFQI